MKKGFTVIELMIVLFIIGLLATVGMGVLGISRAKSRDAKRVSDMQIIRAGLEQYWLRNATYPPSVTAVSLGTGNYGILGSNGFEAAPGTGDVYLLIPTGARPNEYYQYQSTVYSGYAIQLTTERITDLGPAGTYYGHADGSIDVDPTSK